ncbi:MAG TPA: DNA-binding response regulator, partial [Oligoflexia bacterium]|nr:DNA-binding response regulator [Oligoflexia bacterium]
MEKILVVEDHQDLAEVLLLHLRTEGFEADHAADGEEGLRLALTASYTL